MNQIMALLQRRIAGIPAWGWALVIGGTIVGYAYLTRGTNEPEPAPTAPAYLDDSLPSDAGDIPGTDDDTGTDPDREPNITSNPAWLRYVTDALVGTGTYGAVEVTNALNKVLAGIAVNEQEAAIYNVAVTRYGAPPEGHPPIERIPVTPPPGNPPPAPKPSQPAAPRLHHVYAGPGTLTLQWTNSSGAAWYKVYRSIPGPTPGSVVAGDKIRGDYFTIKGLKRGTTYAVSVAAVNSLGVRSGKTSNVVEQRTT